MLSTDPINTAESSKDSAKGTTRSLWNWGWRGIKGKKDRKSYLIDTFVFIFWHVLKSLIFFPHFMMLWGLPAPMNEKTGGIFSEEGTTEGLWIRGCHHSWGHGNCTKRTVCTLMLRPPTFISHWIPKCQQPNSHILWRSENHLQGIWSAQE